MIHPSLTEWQQAKKSALLLAANIPNCELIQTPDGKTKRVIIGKKVIDHATWYAAYSTLHRIKLDMIGNKSQEPAPVAKQPPPLPKAKQMPPVKPARPIIPMATFCD